MRQLERIPLSEQSARSWGPNPSPEWRAAFGQPGYRRIEAPRGRGYLLGMILGTLGWIIVLSALVFGCVLVFQHVRWINREKPVAGTLHSTSLRPAATRETTTRTTTTVTSTSTTTTSKETTTTGTTSTTTHSVIGVEDLDQFGHKRTTISTTSTTSTSTSTTSTSTTSTSYTGPTTTTTTSTWHPMQALEAIFGDKAVLMCYVEGCQVTATKNCQRAAIAGGVPFKLDLATLGEHTNLVHVDLVHCGDYIVGDLHHLAGMSVLRYLAIASSMVTGSTRSFGALTNLRHVSLSDSASGRMTSDLKDFSGHTGLEYLASSLTGGGGLTGSLASLAKLTQLETIKLTHIGKVTGELSSIRSPFLKFLSLQGPSLISGDISWLSNIGTLYSVLIEKIPVVGDLNGFCTPRFLNIHSIKLSDTKVSGDIKSLANCQGVADIDLANTTVAGDVKDLTKVNPGLQTVRLTGTSVSGRVLSLMPIGHILTAVDLSRTRVQSCSESNSCHCEGVDACSTMVQSYWSPR